MGGKQSKTDKFSTDDIPSVKGKVYFVTGANTGLGLETSKVLASKGATVVMAVRDHERSKAAVQEVTKIAETNDGKVEEVILDLGSLASVKEASEKFESLGLPLHCLINNAGIMRCPKSKTKDGFETQFGVNHLGHFALTAQLFPILKKTSEEATKEDPVRIVNLSSSKHSAGPKEGILFDNVDWDDAKQPKYEPDLAYGHSKFANIVFTKEINDRLKDANMDKIITFAVHPGFVDTELTRHVEKGVSKTVVDIYKYVNGALNVHDGALTQLYCATSPEPVEKAWGGEFFVPIAQHSDLHKNAPKITKEMQTKLWDMSEQMTSVSFKI